MPAAKSKTIAPKVATEKRPNAFSVWMQAMGFSDEQVAERIDRSAWNVGALRRGTSPSYKIRDRVLKLSLEPHKEKCAIRPHGDKPCTCGVNLPAVPVASWDE